MSSKISPEHPAGRSEPRLLAASILTMSRFLAVYWALQALAFRPSMMLTWRAIIGLASAILFAVFLRVREARVRTDRRRFVPIDWALLGALVAVNAFLGWTVSFWIFGVTLVGVAASSRWLLRPSMETRPLVGLATRAPIRILSMAYPLALFGADFGFEQLRYGGLLLLGGVWMADAVRDTAAVPRDNPGQARAAAALCALLSLAGAACMILARGHMKLGWPYLAVVGVAEVVALAACLRLLATPAAAPGLVRGAAEIYRMTLLVGLAAVLATFGVSWMEGEPWYTF
jgi:general stress protein CsbA